MKSETNDPPQKVAGEAGVGLRERPNAAGRPPNGQISACLWDTILKNCAMDEETQQKPEQSVANRVLSMFITAVEEDEALAEVATRLKPVLLDGDTVSEAALLQAIFGDES